MGGTGSGGAREGAGRKTIDGEVRSKISVTLPMWQLDLVRSEATRLRPPVFNLITALITKGLEK
ncbi:MAG: hypothetical protein K2J15_00915 [Muribaculaceae bacterium]|nr:hypothetical protein [Muribaculaceae bacterium]